ncbi:hypothetical protein TanjilG_08276 [Lupinus angustifolius]|uniref:Uncharacterized protein n=1 Tax=Lupinus angustifolius TaxID=3871 RepID=A0A1J7GRY7_LUPAN|nr:hypothetical protein TanjilG_08276 [Lupinus angustifolius]
MRTRSGGGVVVFSFSSPLSLSVWRWWTDLVVRGGAATVRRTGRWDVRSARGIGLEPLNRSDQTLRGDPLLGEAWHRVVLPPISCVAREEESPRLAFHVGFVRVVLDG